MKEKDRGCNSSSDQVIDLKKAMTSQGVFSIISQIVFGAQGLGALVLVGRYLPEKEFGFVVVGNAILFAGQCLLLGLITNPTLRFGVTSNKVIHSTLGIYIVTTMIACTAFTFFGAELGSVFFADQDFYALVKFLSIPFTSVSLFYICKVLFQAKMRYALVLLMDLLFGAGNLGILLLLHFGKLLTTGVHYYAARSAGALFGLVPMLFILIWFHKRHTASADQQFNFKGYLQHSKYSLIAQMGSYGQGQVDALAVAYYLGPVAAAMYGAAKIFYTGMAMVTHGLAMVFLPGTSKIIATGSQRIVDYYKKALLMAYLLLLPFAATLVLFPGLLLEILFGDRYANAVPVVRIFALAALVVPISSMTDALANGAGWFRSACLASMTGAVVGVITSLTLTRLLGPSGAALAPVLALSTSSFVIVSAVWRRFFELADLRTY